MGSLTHSFPAGFLFKLAPLLLAPVPSSQVGNEQVTSKSSKLVGEAGRCPATWSTPLSRSFAILGGPEGEVASMAGSGGLGGLCTHLSAREGHAWRGERGGQRPSKGLEAAMWVCLSRSVRCACIWAVWRGVGGC